MKTKLDAGFSLYQAAQVTGLLLDLQCNFSALGLLVHSVDPHPGFWNMATFHPKLLSRKFKDDSQEQEMVVP